MAGFHTKTFLKHDDYMTPRSAWEVVAQFIPKDKVIWEPFYGDGKSGTILTELGFRVIHEAIDFFVEDRGEVLVSNPPFSKSKEILTRLKALGKPFMLILPASKLFTQYVRGLFSGCEDRLQIIVPRKRIQFIKLIDGKVPENSKECCNFDCFYYCWKMGLPNDVVWIN
jgi:hypothetical protein